MRHGLFGCQQCRESVDNTKQYSMGWAADGQQQAANSHHMEVSRQLMQRHSAWISFKVLQVPSW
jgi:hypothetical protein